MGIITSLFPQRRSLENPRTSLSNPDAWFYEALGAGSSASGANVNRKTALTLAAFWRAVNLLGDTVAKIPLYVYARDGEGKQRATDHPAYPILRYKANPTMTAEVFKRTLTAHRITKGNGYAFIDRDGSARVLGLYPLDPERTYPVRVDGVLGYVTTSNGKDVPLRADQVLHIRGLGWDGLLGYSVLEYARDSLGLGMTIVTHQSKVFRNGAFPGVVIEAPSTVKLTAEAAEKLRISWDRLYSGGENAGRSAVLQDGLTAKALSISARDSQMIEAAQQGVRDVSNWTGVPPHKLGDQTRNAYNSLEQENQSFLDDTIDPIFVTWEEECRDKLLSEDEKRRDTHVVEFRRQALIRADMNTRGAFYQKAVGGPWMRADEARGLENMNPMPDGEGSKLYPPPGTSNVPSGDVGTGDPPAEKQPGAKPKRSLPCVADAVDALHRSLITEAVERIVKRIGAQARKTSKTSPKFPDFLESLHDRYIEATVGTLDLPVKIRCALNGADAGTETAQMAVRVIEDIRASLDCVYSTAKPAAFVEAIDVAMTTLETELPGRITADMIG